MWTGWYIRKSVPKICHIPFHSFIFDGSYESYDKFQDRVLLSQHLLLSSFISDVQSLLVSSILLLYEVRLNPMPSRPAGRQGSP